MEDYKLKKIAVIGVSQNSKKYGYKIFSDLLKAGFNVFGINPKGGEVEGKKLFSSIKEINPLPDMILTVVPPVITEKVIEEMNLLGIKRLWMQPGSESDTAISKAKEYGILVTSKKCFMVANGLWKEELKGF
ncbi:MAG: CoA-binding protein [Elusimicrobia bacterium]|nr:CoA-binding protein [Elusimicrobiota bacterium]